MSNRRKTGCFTQLVTLFLMLMVFSCVLSSFMPSTPDEPKDPAEQLEDDAMCAYLLARQRVKNTLAAPGTAEFPPFYVRESHTIHLGGRKFRIESWVDAQNKFGAQLRAKFYATVTVDPGDRCQGTISDFGMNR